MSGSPPDMDDVNAKEFASQDFSTWSTSECSTMTIKTEQTSNGITTCICHEWRKETAIQRSREIREVSSAGNPPDRDDKTSATLPTKNDASRPNFIERSKPWWPLLAVIVTAIVKACA